MKRVVVCVLSLFVQMLIINDASAECSNPNTLKNKIMAGYQGWFQGRDNWRHWTKKFNGSYLPTKDNLTFDLWPDMREYDKSSLSQALTDFNYEDGSEVHLFSSDEKATADLHVKWMKTYGIDGVFVQRFILEAFKIRQFRDDVLSNIRYAAEEHCRVFANMYDISDYRRESNGGKSLEQAIKEDWIHLVKDLGIAESSQYLMHDGKPVVAIWGFGVDERRRSIAGAAEAKRIIDWFHKQNVTVMGGIDGKFLEDSQEWQSVYGQFDIISPWNVGRYASLSSFDSHNSRHIQAQKNWTSNRGSEFLPVVFPGFSWSNLKGTNELNKIPRLGGSFYWHQLRTLINDGHDMIYVAMFDEVDEGTAIFKVAESKDQVPIQLQDRMLTLDYDGHELPSDWYLTLTGLAAKGLKIGQLEELPEVLSNSQESSDITQLVKSLHKDSLVIFDFDDTLYMNGDRKPENIAPHWSKFAADAVALLYEHKIRIAICSANGNKNQALQARLNELNPQIFNDEFFDSGAFLTGTPNANGSHCSYEKDEGVKSILDHFMIKHPKHVVMFDDSERNFTSIKNSSEVSQLGSEISKIGFVLVDKNPITGGLTTKKFREGINNILSLQEKVPPLEEGQGDCDNSYECAEGLVCMNALTGETEEKNSNDNGFTFVVENAINQPGDETCEYPEIPVEATPLLGEGQGDCDNSYECSGELVCMNAVTGETEEKNSNANGFTFVVENQVNQPGDETCEYPEIPVQEISLLEEGQGDCDNSYECAGELVCLNKATGEAEEKNSNENGFTFVVENEINQPGDETCEYPKLPPAETPLLLEGQGDCDNSHECAGDLVCMNKTTGETEEKNSNDNGFTFVVDNEINQPGDETCEYRNIPAQEIALLEEGQGDCDNSYECAGDLVCMNKTTGETEEKNSNDNGFTFVVEDQINQPGDETCELPGNTSKDADDDIKFASNTLVVKNGDKWYFVYCSGRSVKVSRDWNKRQTWKKYGTRNMGVLNGPKLHCPERDGGFSPTLCECNDRTENYHEKRKAKDSHFDYDVGAPASITTNEEIYIGPNNNMNACLKVVKNKDDNSLHIHSPCALEPWKTRQKCKTGGHYSRLLNEYGDPNGSNENVHELDCNEFRLNQ